MRTDMRKLRRPTVLVLSIGILKINLTLKEQLPCHAMRRWSAVLNNCDWKEPT